MPAAALTGFTGPEHRASILRAGFQYHIEKPVSLEKLAGVVALLALKGRSPSQEHAFSPASEALKPPPPP